jgi:uncharacterized membrane protein YdjX (TVP38/TMEM64 family)
MQKRERLVEFVWVAIVVALFIFSIKMLRSGELEALIISLGFWAPFMAVALKMSTLIIAPLGGTPLYVISGAAFGNVEGFILMFGGDILGSSVCFYISRKYGTRFLRVLAGSRNTEKIVQAVNVISSTKSFVKARVGFVTMPELLSYAAGLSRINFWKFSIINALFYAPVDIVLVFLGTQIAKFTASHAIFYFGAVFVVSALGFLFLYKDFQKSESL